MKSVSLSPQSMAIRPLGRVGILFAVVLSIFFLSQSLEPRKTAYSCRTLKNCIGFGNVHRYQFPLDHETAPKSDEVQLQDGTIRFDRVIQNTNPNLLFLVLNKDSKSWSRDFNSGRRTVYDFLDVLIRTDLNLTDASLSFMTTSEDEYNHVKEATSTLPFARTTIMLRRDTGPNIPYLDRHKPSVQLIRRSHIAKLRNYLMFRALKDEKHMVWVDADVAEFSTGILQKMIHHSETNSSVGMITARCQHNHVYNYDKNAWNVDRSIPEILDAVSNTQRDAMTRRLEKSRLYITDVINGTSDDEIRPLDAVGGTILYIRSDLVRQGVHFPYINIVGTTWEKEGWTGVETEGICYMSRTLDGGGCYALGGHNHVRHSDIG